MNKCRKTLIAVLAAAVIVCGLVSAGFATAGFMGRAEPRDGISDDAVVIGEGTQTYQVRITK